MTYVSSFVYCDQIRTEMTPKGPIRSLVTPLSELRPINVPGNYTFSIAATISDFDISKENHIHIFIKSPDGRVINEIVNSTLPSITISGSEKQNTNVINMDLDIRNCVFETEGEYKTIVEINDDYTKEFPFILRKR